MRENSRTRRITSKGVKVVGYLIQANRALFSPGIGDRPCLILMSFQEEVGLDIAYMSDLTKRVALLKGTFSGDRDTRLVASYTTDERAALDRRRLLPTSFTDGSLVYCADLWVDRAMLKGGYLTSPYLPCIAEPGEAGGIMLLSYRTTMEDEANLNG